MTDLVEKASQYAVSAHARINHLRKYTQQPYDVHLRAVAKLVASVTDDPAMIAAAWLHDTVEDTPATFEDLEREFGADVMQLVKELTDVSKPSDGNRATRKALDRDHTAAASPRAKTVKLADIIDNCDDICRHDPKFGRVYLAEARQLMEVLQEGEQRLYGKAAKKIAEFARRLGDSPADTTGETIDTATAIHHVAGQQGIRLFTEAFAARDIMEPLPSFDMESLPTLPGRMVAAPAASPVGIRIAGLVAGYLTSEDLTGSAPPQVRQFDARQVVEMDTSLADVIHVLTHFNCCFVAFNGTIIGVVSRQHMEKPVVRMWLFGIIILIEMLTVEQIRRQWPDGGWTAHVSEGRLEKAKQLQEERQRRGLNADLLDCLQFSDKLQIAIHEPVFQEHAGFQSMAIAKKAMKDLENLRNHLAHGQDIAKHDWPPIVRLARRVQQLFG